MPASPGAGTVQFDAHFRCLMVPAENEDRVADTASARSRSSVR
jgi:hypothetical protein